LSMQNQTNGANIHHNHQQRIDQYQYIVRHRSLQSNRDDQRHLGNKHCRSGTCRCCNRCQRLGMHRRGTVPLQWQCDTILHHNTLHELYFEKLIFFLLFNLKKITKLTTFGNTAITAQCPRSSRINV